jgi:hypothetical protein
MISTDFCFTYQGTYPLKPYIKNQHYYQQWTYMLGVSTQSSFFLLAKNHKMAMLPLISGE